MKSAALFWYTDRKKRGEGRLRPFSRRKGRNARMSEPYRVVIVDDEMISRGYMELFIKPSRR